MKPQLHKMDFYGNRRPVRGKIFAVLLLLSSLLFFAQESKGEMQIDAKISTAQELYKTYKTQEFLSIANEILQKSERINYEKGKVYGNFYIAGALTEIGKHKESIEYIKRSQTYTGYLDSDPLQNARNYGLIGANYNYLELFSLSVKSFSKAISIINEVKKRDPAILLNKSANYGNLSIVYERINKLDSMYYFLNKERQIIEVLDEKNVYVQKSASYISFGNYFLKRNESDSSEYYYKKAVNLLHNKNHPYQVDVFMGLGNLYKEQKKYKEAIDYFFQAVAISKKHDSWELGKSYEGLIDAYEKTGNLEKASELRILYKKTNDSLQTEKKIERDFIVNEIIKFEKEQQQKKNKTEIIWISSVVGVLILLSGIGFFYFIKRKRKELIEEKENIIHEKEEQNLQLQDKVNESFEEVILLAKNNSIEFFTRFKEVYPHVISRLLEIDSKLRVTELSLCAYYFLGFSTKDVAAYTFKSIHTIRNRRQNLRTKLGIPADESIELWLKNL